MEETRITTKEIQKTQEPLILSKKVQAVIM